MRLRQVAPRADSMFSYTYDSGRGWDHDIVVEAIDDAEPGIAHPRCITGRGPAAEGWGGSWDTATFLGFLARCSAC